MSRFLVDTNVVSELRKPSGRIDPGVASWAVDLENEATFISVITVMELERGIRRLERRDPQQGRMLAEWFERDLLPSYETRILPIDPLIARVSARLQARQPRQVPDALLAAAALVHGLTVVTRNVRDFEPLGVPVFDPWS